MVAKVKEKFEKSRHVKSTFYEDKEMLNIMNEFYLIRKSFIYNLT